MAESKVTLSALLGNLQIWMGTDSIKTIDPEFHKLTAKTIEQIGRLDGWGTAFTFPIGEGEWEFKIRITENSILNTKIGFLPHPFAEDATKSDCGSNGSIDGGHFTLSSGRMWRKGKEFLPDKTNKQCVKVDQTAAVRINMERHEARLYIDDEEQLGVFTHIPSPLCFGITTSTTALNESVEVLWLKKVEHDENESLIRREHTMRRELLESAMALVPTWMGTTAIRVFDKDFHFLNTSTIFLTQTLKGGNKNWRTAFTFPIADGEWELKIRTTSSTFLNIMLGYIQNPINDESTQHHCGVYQSGTGGDFTLWGGSMWKHGVVINEGMNKKCDATYQTAAIRVNFEKREAKLFVDDKEQPSIFTDIPKIIRLAISTGCAEEKSVEVLWLKRIEHDEAITLDRQQKEARRMHLEAAVHQTPLWMGTSSLRTFDEKSHSLSDTILTQIIKLEKGPNWRSAFTFPVAEGEWELKIRTTTNTFLNIMLGYLAYPLPQDAELHHAGWFGREAGGDFILTSGMMWRGGKYMEEGTNKKCDAALQTAAIRVNMEKREARLFVDDEEQPGVFKDIPQIVCLSVATGCTELNESVEIVWMKRIDPDEKSTLERRRREDRRMLLEGAIVNLPIWMGTEALRTIDESVHTLSTMALTQNRVLEHAQWRTAFTFPIADGVWELRIRMTRFDKNIMLGFHQSPLPDNAALSQCGSGNRELGGDFILWNGAMLKGGSLIQDPVNKVPQKGQTIAIRVNMTHRLAHLLVDDEEQPGIFTDIPCPLCLGVTTSFQTAGHSVEVMWLSQIDHNETSSLERNENQTRREGFLTDAAKEIDILRRKNEELEVTLAIKMSLLEKMDEQFRALQDQTIAILENEGKMKRLADLTEGTIQGEANVSVEKEQADESSGMLEKAIAGLPIWMGTEALDTLDTKFLSLTESHLTQTVQIEDDDTEWRTAFTFPIADGVWELKIRSTADTLLNVILGFHGYPLPEDAALFQCGCYESGIGGDFMLWAGSMWQGKEFMPAGTNKIPEKAGQTAAIRVDMEKREARLFIDDEEQPGVFTDIPQTVCLGISFGCAKKKSVEVLWLKQISHDKQASVERRAEQDKAREMLEAAQAEALKVEADMETMIEQFEVRMASELEKGREVENDLRNKVKELTEKVQRMKEENNGEDFSHSQLAHYLGASALKLLDASSHSLSGTTLTQISQIEEGWRTAFTFPIRQGEWELKIRLLTKNTFSLMLGYLAYPLPADATHQQCGLDPDLDGGDFDLSNGEMWREVEKLGHIASNKTCEEIGQTAAIRVNMERREARLFVDDEEQPGVFTNLPSPLCLAVSTAFLEDNQSVEVLWMKDLSRVGNDSEEEVLELDDLEMEESGLDLHSAMSPQLTNEVTHSTLLNLQIERQTMHHEDLLSWIRRHFDDSGQKETERKTDENLSMSLWIDESPPETPTVVSPSQGKGDHTSFVLSDEHTKRLEEALDQVEEARNENLHLEAELLAQKELFEEKMHEVLNRCEELDKSLLIGVSEKESFKTVITKLEQELSTREKEMDEMIESIPVWMGTSSLRIFDKEFHSLTPSTISLSKVLEGETGNWRTAFTIPLRSGEWELKIRSIQHRFINLALGFLEFPLPPDALHADCGYYKNKNGGHFTLWSGRMWRRGEEFRPDGTNRRCRKVGQTAAIRINMSTREAKLFVDDEEQPVCFTDIPAVVCLGISMNCAKEKTVEVLWLRRLNDDQSLPPVVFEERGVTVGGYDGCREEGEEEVEESQSEEEETALEKKRDSEENSKELARASRQKEEEEEMQQKEARKQAADLNRTPLKQPPKALQLFSGTSSLQTYDPDFHSLSQSTLTLSKVVKEQSGHWRTALTIPITSGLWELKLRATVNPVVKISLFQSIPSTISSLLMSLLPSSPLFSCLSFLHLLSSHVSPSFISSLLMSLLPSSPLFSCLSFLHLLSSPMSVLSPSDLGYLSHPLPKNATRMFCGGFFGGIGGDFILADGSMWKGGRIVQPTGTNKKCDRVGQTAAIRVNMKSREAKLIVDDEEQPQIFTDLPIHLCLGISTCCSEEKTVEVIWLKQLDSQDN
ncbi:hypothetical protein BLNAU_16657 [Blattamonas nauphoetae]|uniref:Uncharacterized protein n=1 Tax=Blattamonas nauphoetae TaxID=2049346 RepID=A0ABQ9XCM7_9EUKA|nr:hypothetical protein BLNAU_16657 [Blattamonas nauphoetae]